MSLFKSEIKRATINEMGALAEDTMEQAKKDYHLAHGASVGLGQVRKKIEGLAKHVDQDLDDGNLDMSSPLEIASYIKKYLQRAVAVVNSDAMSYEQRMLMAQGASMAFERYVGTTKKLFDLETQKIEKLKEVEAEEEETSPGSNGRYRRVAGVRPGIPVKQRRIAEDQTRLTGETSPKPKKKVRRLASDASDS